MSNKFFQELTNDMGPQETAVPEINPDVSSWYAYEQPDFEKMAGSPIDMSFLLDAPAGKHGRVQRKGDKFFFEDGTRARFLGTNIVAEANFLPKEEIDRLVQWIAMTGYNMVRLHHLDADWSRPNIFGNGESTLSLDTEQLDKVDYLCAKCKEHGIYLYVDALVSRLLKPGEVEEELGFVEFGAKIIGHFYPSIIQRQKEYLEQLFCHINPYTGMSLAEDPALVMVDIHNEDSMLWRPGLGWAITDSYRAETLQNFVNTWLLKKYSSTGELRQAWEEEGKVSLKEGESLEAGNILLPNDFYEDEIHNLSHARKRDFCECLFEIQVNYYQEMAGYMRDVLGMKCMICGSNVPETQDTLDIFANLSFDADFLDRHRYYAHPEANYWNLCKDFPVRNSMKSMLEYIDDRNMVYYFGKRDVYGIPYVMSEWNSCDPNPYCGTEMITMNAYSALHGWTPINFAFLQGKQPKNNELLFVFNTSVSPVKLAMQAISAPMFLRTDVSETDIGCWDVISKQQALDPDFEQDVPDGLPFLAKSGMIWEDLEYSREGKRKNCEDLRECAKNANGVFVSVTGELKTDSVNRIFEVNTASTQGFSGFVAGKELVFDDVDIQSNMGYASVILTSLEDATIANSAHMLLATAARNRNSGQLFSDDATVMKESGKEPLLIEPVTAVVQLKTGHDYEVYALDSSGQRKKKLSTERMTDGRCKIVLAAENKAIFYEFVKTRNFVTESMKNRPEWTVDR